MPRLLSRALMGLLYNRLPGRPLPPRPSPLSLPLPPSHARFGNDILPNFTALRIAYFAGRTKSSCRCCLYFFIAYFAACAKIAELCIEGSAASSALY